MPADPTQLDPAALREAAERATKGEWETDSSRSEGSYGCGDDIHEGFDAYVVYADGKAICDTHNADIGEVHEEYDEDCRHHAWDEIGRRNMAYIVAAQPRMMLALLDALAAKDARIRELVEMLRRAEWWISTVPDGAAMAQAIRAVVDCREDDGSCIRCGGVPRGASGLCATCLDEDAERAGEISA